MEIAKTGNRPKITGRTDGGGLTLSDDTVMGKSDLKNMKYYYKKQGFTQEQLAQQFNVSLEVVQKVTRSKSSKFNG